MSDTNTTPTPEAPKKKNYFTLKNLFWAIAIVLGLLGVDHYTLNVVSGGSVTITDSTIVVAPAVDTTVVDTTNKD